MSERRTRIPVRQARIEFLRARAAYEREALSFHTAQLGQSIHPKRWFSRKIGVGQMLDTGGHSGVAGLIGQGFSLASQYPYLTATISSLLVGKRWRWIRWLGVGFAVWQAVSVSAPTQNKNDVNDDSKAGDKTSNAESPDQVPN